MIRKLGVMAISLAMAGASMAATVAGKDARDTSDSPAWAPIGLVNVNKAGTVFFPILNVGF